MSALPLETVPVLPRRTRPRLQLVGPGFVPQPPLPDEAAGRPAPRALVPGPASAPVPARPDVPTARPDAVTNRPLARPQVAAASVRGDSFSRPTPMRLTARGVIAVRTLTFVVALAVVVALGAVAGAMTGPGVEASGETVVVAPGESLWVVAGGVADPGEDVRDVVAEIAELNGLSGGTVSAGQVLQLPR